MPPVPMFVCSNLARRFQHYTSIPLPNFPFHVWPHKILMPHGTKADIIRTVHSCIELIPCNYKIEVLSY
jgi:hypothetical protein